MVGVLIRRNVMRQYNRKLAGGVAGLLVVGIILCGVFRFDGLYTVPIFLLASALAYYLGRVDIEWEQKHRYGGGK